jgi:hypothetical protein
LKALNGKLFVVEQQPESVSPSLLPELPLLLDPDWDPEETFFPIVPALSLRLSNPEQSSRYQKNPYQLCRSPFHSRLPFFYKH